MSELSQAVRDDYDDMVRGMSAASRTYVLRQLLDLQRETELVALWEVARALASRWEDYEAGGTWRCRYCSAHSVRNEGLVHRDDCPITRFNTLDAERIDREEED